MILTVIMNSNAFHDFILLGTTRARIQMEVHGFVMETAGALPGSQDYVLVF